MSFLPPHDSSLFNPLVVLYALTALCLLGFIGLYLRERRSVFVGWLLIATVGLLGTSLGVTAIVSENQILLVLAFLIVIIPAVLSIFTPLGLTGLFLYSGIRLIVREGFSLTNSLALAAGAALIVGPFFVPGPAENVPLGGVWGTIYFYLSLVLTYFTIYAVGFTVAAALNLVNFRKQADYVVVLGSGLMGDQVTPLLAARIDRGIEIYRKNPGSKLIMSGGQGADEEVPEGVAMTRYAIARGVPEADIIVEDRAVNTRENLLFSYALMPEVAEGKTPKVALATTNYHLFRALLLARSLGLKCWGSGAPTKVYFAVNAFIREFIGYLSMTRRRHIITLSVCTVLYIAVALFVWWMYSFGLVGPGEPM